MRQSVKILNVFKTLPLKQIFCKTKTFFERLEYRFSVESTKIENASFPYQFALLKANVKTNRIASTKWTYHKERSLASKYFKIWNFKITWKICFSLRTAYKELFWYTSDPNVIFIFICPYSFFLQALKFCLRVIFSCEYP